MLKKFKQATLRSLKTTGVSRLVHNSHWRRQRLVILTYHGIATDDEHLWNNSLFMSPELFRTRLELIKRSGCSVLPLDEAIKRLYENDLPQRAVAITFDDGHSDFREKAFPLIKEFDFPVTLYLTTFYSEYNRPVFDVMCAYLLWKGRNETLNLKALTGREARLDLRSAASRESAGIQLLEFARAEKLSAEEKDTLAASLAENLKVDYAALLERRALHLVTPDEVRQLAADGIDIQLHTHRHRMPLDRGLFLREIEDNRKSIQAMTGTRASHFCYPSGEYNLAFLPWLREAGVVSATTCEQGMASPSSNPLLLPRLIDVSSLSSIEFESWLTGISAALPRRGLTKRAHVGETS
jgi:peptidoglycan/xylan/chitin deacetylase (PgdA/CDA1 family)